MDIDHLISRVLCSNDPNMEFELRFGKYGRVSSNITEEQFFSVMRLKKNPQYSFIDEAIYDDTHKTKRRTTYVNSTHTEKMFKSGVSMGVMEKIKKTAGKGTTIFIVKEKHGRPVNANTVKAEIALEKEVSQPNAEIAVTRQKYRCSWLDKMWLFDLSIILITKGGQSGVFYEVEIEYQSSRYTHEQVNVEAQKHINTITTILYCCDKTAVETIIKHEISNSVATLERKDLQKLQHAKYALVDKADGERKFVYIASNGDVSHFNPTQSIIARTPLFKSKMRGETVIDCELIENNGKKTFYGFDLLFYEGKDYRSYNLTERLFLLNKTIETLQKFHKLKSSSLPDFKMKTFYMDAAANVKKVWGNRGKLFPYELDGLIFTPIRGAYISNLLNLKYKPAVSIDVRVFYNTRDNFTEFHARGFPRVKNGTTVNAVHIGKKTFYKMRMTFNDPNLKHMGVVNDYGVLGVAGRIEQPDMENIVEMEFKNGKWVFLRTRSDKEYANASKSVQSAITAISDNITIDELSKLKHIKSPYEKMGSPCFSKVGFNFHSPDITSSVCNFYTYAYSKMIAGKGSILVIGCDMCLLNGLLQGGYQKIDIYEENCLEVYGEEQSEGYRGLKEHLRNVNEKEKTTKKVSINWGTYKGSAKYDTAFINNLQDMADIAKYKAVAKNVMGSYLSKERIEAYMKRHPCMVLRNGELHPLWKLRSSGKLEISKLRNSLVAEECMALSDKQFKKCKTFKSMVPMGRSAGYPLSEYDSIIADLTRIFF